MLLNFLVVVVVTVKNAVMEVLLSCMSKDIVSNTALNCWLVLTVIGRV